uniref:winged helix-turn-helix transcriptional regulator n=1 Tax=Altererythrobacter segetis TaxID=1104773 RepID=UPI001FAEB582|nr:winged helix-turn-helix transcriptional regulator [Altererythrobacter segetis]
MTTFGWVAGMRDPPWQWDLRRLGWSLCGGRGGLRAECRHVLLADARELSHAEREGMAEADRPAWRLLMLGIEEPAERAALLTLGCAEALPATVGLRELEARAHRVDEMFGMLPRWRSLGPLTLDLFHRDARRGGRWLALHPREFGVLWRLADNAGQRVTRVQLLRDVWRLNHEPETNSVEVHISRLRSKLAEFGCEGLVATDPRGGYRLYADRMFLLDDAVAEEDALDAYLRRNALWQAEAELEDG